MKPLLNLLALLASGAAHAEGKTYTCVEGLGDCYCDSDDSQQGYCAVVLRIGKKELERFWIEAGKCDAVSGATFLGKLKECRKRARELCSDL